jgi:hypothetical protein
MTAARLSKVARSLGKDASVNSPLRLNADLSLYAFFRGIIRNNFAPETYEGILRRFFLTRVQDHQQFPLASEQENPI